ncbi:hypothetical protein MKX01_016615 [Papaver californicum]|nr:hypothetical protein MKX01_016615 [Papaver californicum]
MSSTLLEVTRSKHEQVERFERLIGKDFENEPTSNRERLFQDHRLIEIYQDNDNARKDEIESEELLLKEEPHVEFSGEEGHGRYLDLHEIYKTNQIPCKLKLTSQYREYLEHLLEYLISFFQRKEPLLDLVRIFSKVETDFEHLWEDGKIQGCKKSKGLENWDVSSRNSIDLAYYSTVDELIKEAASSREKEKELNEALPALGLKSGGTVQQLEERLFLTKYTPVEQLDKKQFVNGAASQERQSSRKLP